MADYAFFYNSENGDRKYDADSFSDWLKKFFTSGVFEGDLQVTANNSMQINVGSGYVNVEGKVRIFDTSTDLIVETANPTYNRIDTVVVERNDTDRNITLKVVTGGYSTNPVPTAPVRANGIYQLVLAQIYVSAGATAITQANITDKRTDTSVCGYVVTPVNTFDFEQFTTQANAYIEEFEETSQASFEAWEIAQKTDFDTWFDNLVYVLDGDVAGHLQNEIDDINARMSKTGGSNIHCTFDSSLVSKTVTLTTEEDTYTSTVSSDLDCTFDGILEIGSMTIECDGNSKTINVECYSWYEVEIGIAPAYDYQGWLDSANITTSFANLSAVLASETTVRTLFTKHDSVLYLIEWAEADETSATTILNNDIVAKWINLRDYALDTLYASTTCKAIMDEADKYGYGEWVQIDGTWQPKGNVPVMTSNSAPYGEAFVSGTLMSGKQAYMAFLGDTSGYCSLSSGDRAVGYKFVNPVCVKRISFMNDNNKCTFTFEGSNDGTTYETLASGLTVDGVAQIKTIDIENNNYYLYYRVHLTQMVSGTNFGMYVLQFYGRELSVSVPTMTSNTSPWGTVIGYSEQTSRPYYYAFDGNDTTRGDASTDSMASGNYLGYNFGYDVFLKKATVLQASGGTNTVKLQGYNGSAWEDISEEFTIEQSVNKIVDVTPTKSYKQIRLYKTGTSANTLGLYTLQFYGLDYSEHAERHYIYEHGLELEELDFVYGANNGGYGKANNNAYIKSTSSAESFVKVLNKNGIDVTSYSLARANTQNGINITSDSAYISISADKNNLTSYNYFYNIMPYNIYVDISSVNGSAYVGFGVESKKTATVEMTSLWLE